MFEGSRPLAWLLEGSFNSLYKNRLLPAGSQQSAFRAEGVPTGIVVISDGDFIKNEISVETGQPLQLGLEQFSKKQFANEDFLRNTLSYLLDEEGLIEARVKEFKIRPLDRVRVEKERRGWVWFNMGLPLLIVLLFGLTRFFVRRAMYR